MMSKIQVASVIVWILLFSLPTQSIDAQDLDTNLEFARSFYKEQIHFIDKINDSVTIAASQKNVYLFNDVNIIIDTLNEVQNLNQNNLIQNIESLDDGIVFLGTMKNLMIFNFINNQLVLSKNILYNKSFEPWKDKHQLRFLTKNGFLGITIPLSKKRTFEVYYYPEKENYQDKILVYNDDDSHYSVFSRSEWSKNIDFVDDIILINDFHRSTTILFDSDNNTANIIELPVPEGFNYSFISYDRKMKQYYLLSKNQKGNTEIRKYDIDIKEPLSEKWFYEHNVFNISEDRIWYKKFIESERLLGLFSFPFNEEEKDNIILLEEVTINDDN